MDFCDANLPPASRQTGSRLSISTIVDSMCCLGQKAEETLGLIGANRLHDVLTKNNMFNRKKIVGNILGEIRHVPKICSAKSPAGPDNLASALWRRESDPALSMSVASDTHKWQGESSSRCFSPDLDEMLEISWLWKSAQQCYAEEAYNSHKNSEEAESTVSLSDSSEDDLSYLEDIIPDSNSDSQHAGVGVGTKKTNSTIGISYTSLNAVLFLEDTNCKQIPEPQDDTKVTNRIGVSSDVSETDLQFSERIRDTTYSVISAQSRNANYEDDNGITLEESPSLSSKDQFWELPKDPIKKQRRQISQFFYSLFCCLPTPKKRETTSR